MDFYQAFILGSLTVLSLFVIIISRMMKKDFTSMQGMTISMYFSMNIGLTVGVLLGISFQGNLYYSTVLSIIIGSIVGLVCGSNFGIIAMLEGIMAGLMGGMMGAMLGEMVNGEQSIKLIRILLLFSFSTIFLFAILPSNTKEKVQSQIWLLKPFILLIFIATYFLWGVPYAETRVDFIDENPMQHHD